MKNLIYVLIIFILLILNSKRKISMIVATKKYLKQINPKNSFYYK